MHCECRYQRIIRWRLLNSFADFVARAEFHGHVLHIVRHGLYVLIYRPSCGKQSLPPALRAKIELHCELNILALVAVFGLFRICNVRRALNWLFVPVFSHSLCRVRRQYGPTYIRDADAGRILILVHVNKTIVVYDRFYRATLCTVYCSSVASCPSVRLSSVTR